jgi:hypothetical protein
LCTGNVPGWPVLAELSPKGTRGAGDPLLLTLPPAGEDALIPTGSSPQQMPTCCDLAQLLENCPQLMPATGTETALVGGKRVLPGERKKSSLEEMGGSNPLNSSTAAQLPHRHRYDPPVPVCVSVRAGVCRWLSDREL